MFSIWYLSTLIWRDFRVFQTASKGPKFGIMCKLIFKGVLLLIAHSMSILGLLEPVHHLAFLANFRHQTVPRAYVYITQWLYLCWFSHTVPRFDKTLTFSRVFHPKFFWQFFSWNQSGQQLKSPKPQHFHEFFIKKKSTIFSGNQSWIFVQCVLVLWVNFVRLLRSYTKW